MIAAICAPLTPSISSTLREFDAEITEETVRALAAIGALRDHGALAHSNLEDGSATQASHFGAYLGWAALV